MINLDLFLPKSVLYIVIQTFLEEYTLTFSQPYQSKARVDGIGSLFFFLTYIKFEGSQGRKINSHNAIEL